MYRKYKTEEEKKKKRKILAIVLPLSILAVAAAATIPTVIVLNKKTPDQPAPGPSPTPEPYTGPTFKFSGTKLLGFREEVTTKILLQRFPNGLITIPECSEIANNAFDGKIPSSITKLILPSNTTRIGDNAFANNKSISTISFYENKDVGDWLVEEFGNKAFYNTGLTSFVFPPKLLKIGQDCFNKCKNLSYLDFTIYPKASSLICNIDSFSNINKEGVVYVRKGSVDGWKASLFNAGIVDPDTLSDFSKYWNVIEFTCLDIVDDICYGFKQDIPAYLQFLIEEESKELLIPNTVKHISNSRNGFNNNQYIKKIIISSSVETIDSESFKGCKNLNTIDVLEYDTVPNWSGSNLFIDCAQKGVVQINNRLRKKWRSLFEDKSGLIIGDDYWQVGYDEFALENCLCAKIVTGSFTFKLENTKTRVVNLQWLKNNEGDWQEFDKPVSLSAGDTFYLKGDNKDGWNNMDNDRCITKFFFQGDGSISIGGSIMGLINNGYETSDIIPCDGCFRNLFKSNTMITEVSPDFLSPLILKPYCYCGLFNGCSKLIESPLLPAVQMEEGCYDNMFYGCYAITNPPELKSTKLAKQCYESMFFQCTSLTSTPLLPAVDLQPYCYENMFNFCTSLTNVKPIEGANIAEGCYKQMFMDCIRLVNAPDLIATELQPYCYNQMFYNCKSLTNVKVYFNTWLESATTNWLIKVPSSGNFTCPGGLNETIGDNYIPNGWTVIKSVLS